MVSGTPPSSAPGSVDVAEQERRGTSPAPGGVDFALRICGLTKKYGKAEVLRGLDLSVPTGRVYGFLGRNGAGKSTTMRTIMGMQRADEGEIFYFGERARRPLTRHKIQIGYVGQEQSFYPWMQCRQLGRFVSGFFPSWESEEFARLLDVFSLPPKRRAGELSGGMQVKLALALALSHRPGLLVLDEPTSGLDPVARREFLDIIVEQSQHRGCTTLFSSHIVAEVERVAHGVGILEGGRLKFEGDPADLVSSIRRLRDVEGVDPSDLPAGVRRISIEKTRRETSWILRAEGSTTFPEGLFSQAPQLASNGDNGADDNKARGESQDPNRRTGAAAEDHAGEAWVVERPRSASFPGQLEPVTLEDAFLALATGDR